MRLKNEGTFEFNGINSRTFDIYVSEVPKLNRPKRKIDTYTVPGRNGVIVKSQDAWENVTQSYKTFAGCDPEDATAYSDLIAEWLSVSGYKRLEDSFNPDIYRLAYADSELDIESIMTVAAVTTIEFSCDPRRFLKSGERIYTFTSGASLVNPTKQTANPLITVYGSGAGTLTIGNYTISISEIGTMVTINTEIDKSYNGTTNRGYTIKGDLPKLLPGSNPISISGGIEKIEIKPNWWRL